MANQNTESNQNEPYLKIDEMTRDEIHREIYARVSRIDREFTRAFEFIQKYPVSVSFFGSARVTEDNPNYGRARGLAAKIVRELGYTILSGGSGGIMEAANRGAFEAGGKSIGLNIRLPNYQKRNQFLTDSMEFSYFFVRKLALSFAAEAYIFFPGGFGTLDEFFEIVTLIQTRKIPRVPIIMVGHDYWTHVLDFSRKVLLTETGAISKNDLDLFQLVDDDDKIIEIIKKVPIKSKLTPSRQD